MDQWETDIHEHRRLVAYYMGDFIRMCRPLNACTWNNIDAIEADHLTLYRLAQHCVASRGTPDITAINEKHGASVATIVHNTASIDLANLSSRLSARAEVHDLSKFHPPERETFEVFTPKLKTLVYGSDEYKQALADMGTGLQHHYAVNSHHPEYHENGVLGMSLMDLIEMFCDWVAACDMKRVQLNIEQHAVRFDISPRLAHLLAVTCKQLRQWHAEHNCPSYF